MSGGGVKRLPINTAPAPELTSPFSQYFARAISDPQGLLQQTFPTTALQGQALQGLQSLLAQPNPQIRTQGTSADIQASLAGQPGGGFAAAQVPAFLRGQETALGRFQQSLPRFSSGSAQLVGEQGTRQSQDLGAFLGSALLSGRQQLLSELIQSGNLGLQQQFAGLPFFQQILGLATPQAFGQPIIEQKQGFFGNLIGTLGALGGLAAPFFPPAAAAPGLSGLLNTGTSILPQTPFTQIDFATGRPRRG